MLFWCPVPKHWTQQQHNKTAQSNANKYPTFHFSPRNFCSLKKGLTPKMHMLCFVLINCVLLNLLCLDLAMTMFKGLSSVKQFQLRALCSYPIKLKICGIVNYIMWIMADVIFHSHMYLKEIKFMDLHYLKKTFNTGLFLDILKGGLLKFA